MSSFSPEAHWAKEETENNNSPAILNVPSNAAPTDKNNKRKNKISFRDSTLLFLTSLAALIVLCVILINMKDNPNRWEAKATMGSIALLEEEYYQHHGEYTDSIENLIGEERNPSGFLSDVELKVDNKKQNYFASLVYDQKSVFHGDLSLGLKGSQRKSKLFAKAGGVAVKVMPMI